jgi:hypothetical protein
MYSISVVAVLVALIGSANAAGDCTSCSYPIYCAPGFICATRGGSSSCVKVGSVGERCPAPCNYCASGLTCSSSGYCVAVTNATPPPTTTAATTEATTKATTAATTEATTKATTVATTEATTKATTAATTEATTKATTAATTKATTAATSKATTVTLRTTTRASCGSPCSSDSNCVSGTSCLPDASGMKRCRRYVGKGQSCKNEACDVCSSGLKCSYGVCVAVIRTVPVTTTVKPTVPLCGSCGHGKICERGLECKMVGYAMKCVKYAGKGDACNSNKCIICRSGKCNSYSNKCY